MMEMIEIDREGRRFAALEQARGPAFPADGWPSSLAYRAAVHKAIAALRESGLAIDAVTGEGYRLASDDDSLTAAGINALLDTAVIGREILVEPSLYLVQHDDEGAVSRPQTRLHAVCRGADQRTRTARPHSSPLPTPACTLTILLHPTLPLSHLSFVTISAAIAVVRAIEQTAGFTPQIKMGERRA